jgi:NADH-quinone oxidoreductase subunit G
LSGGVENADLVRIGEVPLYATDMLVRRAGSLQNTPDAKADLIRVNAATAQRFGLQQDANARVAQGENAVTLPVAIDDRIADGCVWVASGVVETAGLGASFGAIQVELS